jgi:hypothetical protein
VSEAWFLQFFTNNAKRDVTGMKRVQSTPILLSLGLILAITVSPIAAQSCGFINAATGAACVKGCCTGVACCAKPAKNTAPAIPPLVTTASGQDLSLSAPLPTQAAPFDFSSRAYRISAWETTIPNSQPKRAFLCVFLI